MGFDEVDGLAQLFVVGETRSAGVKAPYIIVQGYCCKMKHVINI